MQIKDLEGFFIAGGVVAWPLLVFSVIVIALVAERAFFWFYASSRQVRVIRSVLSLYREEPASCLKLLKSNPRFPLARIFLEALELRGVNPEVFRIAIESASQAELPKLKRFNTVFETIITVAPLLGLMGTIIGLIRSFGALQLGDLGATNTSAITGGIGEALYSTVMGLTVAIATLFFYNIFRSFYRRQLAVIQEYGGQLELLYRLKYETGEHLFEELEESEESEDSLAKDSLTMDESQLEEEAKPDDSSSDFATEEEEKKSDDFSSDFALENETEVVTDRGEKQDYAST